MGLKELALLTSHSQHSHLGACRGPIPAMLAKPHSPSIRFHIAPELARCFSSGYIEMWARGSGQIGGMRLLWGVLGGF